MQFEHGQTVKTRITKPSVQVRATAPAQAILHDPVIFRLEVANTGSATAQDVVLTDELPDGLQFIDGKPTPKPEKPLTWKLGDLAPGQTRRVEYQAISKQTGAFRNKAEVKAAGGVRQKASSGVTVGEAKLTSPQDWATATARQSTDTLSDHGEQSRHDRGDERAGVRRAAVRD